MEEVKITPAMELATEVLGLTKWGQMKLIGFSDSSLDYAAKEIRGAKGLKDPFSTFVSLAKSYSERKGLAINWAHSFELIKKYPMPLDATYVKPRITPLHNPKKSPTSFEVRTINETEEYIKAAIAVESGATAAYEKAFGCKPPLPFARSVGGPSEMSDNSPEIINNLCAAYEEKA